jgi:hypothetical protein
MKAYAIEYGFWLLAIVGPIVLGWLGKWFAQFVQTLAPKAISAISAGIDHLIEWSKSALVDRALLEARSLIGPIIEHAFSTASKEILKAVADKKVSKEEAQLALRAIGEQVKADVKAATAVWKERMKPYLGDTDKLIEALTEEIYEVVKRNFLERSSAPELPSGAPVSK